MLYPRESESRDVKDLSGIWDFKLDAQNVGREQKWFARPLTETIPMPVPASYNDITQDPAIRDHIGDVWYERTFFVPAGWKGKRVVLRVGSATHHAVMWVNGSQVASHRGGYLPFEADVSGLVHYGGENRVTIVVNNVLDFTTLPPGIVKKVSHEHLKPGYTTQEYFHDFFNYAGIHRPVRLYCTPKIHVDDITVVTDVKGRDGIVQYDVHLAGGSAPVRVRLIDHTNAAVAEADGASGTLTVKNARLWQPGAAYLYTLEVAGGEDIYRLPVGIRTVKVTDKQFFINGKPFHFRGFGKHEDMDIRGKGLDDAVNVKDFNLLKWIGANSFRTSHYPYSEEIMNLADRLGMVVIDESPAVGMKGNQAFFTADISQELKDSAAKRLEHHLEVMRQLIARDKNHPCVVMWSVANEPDTKHAAAGEYFKVVCEETRKLDPQNRPITLIECLWPHQSTCSQYVDVICWNSYTAWYGHSGVLEAIIPEVTSLLRGWHERFHKPLFITEFGADTIHGFHSDPPVMWSEEYQCELIANYCKAMDSLDFVIGEHVWNFADFATKQGTGRVIGNRKGVFTRNRQPKMAAHLLRKRWTGA